MVGLLKVFTMVILIFSFVAFEAVNPVKKISADISQFEEYLQTACRIKKQMFLGFVNSNGGK